MRFGVKSVGENPTAAYIQSQAPYSLLHLVSTSASAQPIVDPDFNFGVQNSLKLRRVTEYCQWVESYDEKQVDEAGNKIRTYYYGVQWLSRPTSSAHFDQPFRHSNPQRDPFPSTELISPAVTVGAVRIDTPLGSRAENIPWRHIYYDQQALNSVSASPAASAYRFVPVGNGYFYSVFEEGMFSKVAKLAGMALEGSLDVQLADFFQQCTAGDIRIHYEAMDLASVPREGISLIGQLNNPLEVGVHVARNGQEVGLLVGGKHYDPQALLDRHLNNASWSIWVLRLVICPMIAFFASWSLGSATSFMRIVALSIEVWLVIFATANGFNETLFIASQNKLTSILVGIIFLYAVLSGASQQRRLAERQQRLDHQQQAGGYGMPKPSAPAKDQ